MTEWYLSFHQTISIHNIFDFWKLHEWLELLREEDYYGRIEGDRVNETAWHVSLVNSPQELNPRILPIKYREDLLNEFKEYIEKCPMGFAESGIQNVFDALTTDTMSPEEREELLTLCARRTHLVDKTRQQYIKDYIPQARTVIFENRSYDARPRKVSAIPKKERFSKD